MAFQWRAQLWLRAARNITAVANRRRALRTDLGGTRARAVNRSTRTLNALVSRPTKSTERTGIGCRSVRTSRGHLHDPCADERHVGVQSRASASATSAATPTSSPCQRGTQTTSEGVANGVSGGLHEGEHVHCIRVALARGRKKRERRARSWFRPSTRHEQRRMRILGRRALRPSPITLRGAQRQQLRRPNAAARSRP